MIKRAEELDCCVVFRTYFSDINKAIKYAKKEYLKSIALDVDDVDILPALKDEDSYGVHATAQIASAGS
jgi:hypothetical protein